MLPSRRARAITASSFLAEPRERLDDDARFLLSWFERPLLTGAVMPSGKRLAQTMASYVDPDQPGCVVELGPGTGPVTEALLARGLPEERLILVEYSPDFCTLLRRRFPDATVIRADAYDIRKALGSTLREPATAVISSLPLLTKPPEVRRSLLRDAHAIMRPDGPFVQFTYGVAPPIEPRDSGSAVTRSSQVWRNLPPARVWVYRPEADALVVNADARRA